MSRPARVDHPNFNVYDALGLPTLRMDYTTAEIQSFHERAQLQVHPDRALRNDIRARLSTDPFPTFAQVNEAYDYLMDIGHNNVIPERLIRASGYARLWAGTTDLAYTRTWFPEHEYGSSRVWVPRSDRPARPIQSGCNADLPVVINDDDDDAGPGDAIYVEDEEEGDPPQSPPQTGAASSQTPAHPRLYVYVGTLQSQYEAGIPARKRNAVAASLGEGDRLSFRVTRKNIFGFPIPESAPHRYKGETSIDFDEIRLSKFWRDLPLVWDADRPVQLEDIRSHIELIFKWTVREKARKGGETASDGSA